jgi:hypothetical protein
VLYWVVKGKTNRDIGDILGSSPATVKKHLERVYVKLVSRRAPHRMLIGGRAGRNQSPSCMRICHRRPFMDAGVRGGQTESEDRRLCA